MFRRLLTSAALVAFTALAVNINAATFTVTPEFAGAFVADGTFTPIPGFDITKNPGSPAVLQFDFKLNFTPSADETFGAITFDINLGPGLTENGDVPGWQAFNPPIDFNGALPGGNAPLFNVAGDLGLTDLKNITASVAANLTTNPAVDPRLMVGTGAVVDGNDLNLLGTLYLNWDGTTKTSVSVDIVDAASRRANDGFLYIDPASVSNGGQMAVGEDGTVTGPGIFASTPSPGSVLDFGFGPNTRSLQLAVGNVADPGSDDIEVAQAVISGANASLFSTPGFAPLTLVAGAADSNIGVQFNGIGTPGVYTATLTLLDDAGATLGTYTLTASVPEPSTVALASLGLVGLVGFLRRRK
jgi:hypothetical protein